ncbi:unnamed protein product [Parnassius apollo]|uniref:(apollo) hypothetical protein n=1 Tax=Parnassius apollo TaxID=110799 RepID=A0A8S3WU15_PARAO|nr:unnamed protein product [Parnassius apollo]
MFIVLLHLFVLICAHQEINLLQFIFKFYIVVLSVDAFETWLKYKHRTTCLKKLSSQDNTKLKNATAQLSKWLYSRWLDYVYLREQNHTKAFLLLQIIIGLIFFICKHISGYAIIYILGMVLSISYKLTPPMLELVKKIKQSAESDLELEGLVPDVSDANMDLLSIEQQEQTQIIDERQSLDYWKPEDLPIEDASDSSENSSLLVTNLSMEKMQTFEQNIETSDSSEDEYIPQDTDQPKERFQSTLVVQPVDTWTNAAYNVFQNFGGAVANIMYTSQEDKKRKRISSIDSSDGFEIIDKNDIM